VSNFVFQSKKFLFALDIPYLKHNSRLGKYSTAHDLIKFLVYTTTHIDMMKTYKKKSLEN
jgi:hypothetical protein